MAGETKMLTREECLACVKANRGEAAEKIARLKELCAEKAQGCLLAQAELDELEAANPGKAKDVEIEE